MADLRAQYRSIKTEIDTAVLHSLENAHFILGPEVAAFERDFAAYQQAAECVAVNSGTSALHIALLAAGVGPGDEVITVPFSFIATAAAIVYTGARPVFIDIDPVTFNMDPARIEAAISPSTKAILPVHLYGHPAEMDAILKIARAHNLVVIEDAAQAHAAEYRSKRVGALGDIGCFSFYPAKNLGAGGEGGAAVTNNPQYAHSMRLLRDWGSEKKYVHSLKAYNYRMEGLQGAMLGVKLRHLDRWTAARECWAGLYNELLNGAGIGLPRAVGDVRHVWHCYTMRVAKRDRIQASLAAAGVQTGVHYPIPIHLQPAYADCGYVRGDFPVAEQAAEEVLSIPVHADLNDGQVRQVAAAVRAAVNEDKCG